MSAYTEMAEIVLHDFKSMTAHHSAYDATKSLYQIKPSLYTKFRGKSKTHTWRGGAKCVICLENKQAVSARWCRGCDSCICAGCYKMMKSKSSSNKSPIVPIIYDKDIQDWYDTKSEQPKCPTCREQGLFAPQGIRASRIIKFGNEYHGPNFMVDTKLNKYMAEYVAEYNKILNTIFTMNEEREEEDRTNYKKMTDSKVIKNINKTILDKRKEIKKLQDECIKLENDKEEWKSINYTKKASPVNTQTLIDRGIEFTTGWKNSGKSNTPKYYDEHDYEHSLITIAKKIDVYPTSMKTERPSVVDGGDKRIARNCEFSRLGGMEGMGAVGERDDWGGEYHIFTKINEKFKQLGRRFDDLICGLALPIPPISVQAVSMTDAELEAKMAEMMAVMEARKKQKD